jgi:hypothetical protein
MSFYKFIAKSQGHKVSSQSCHFDGGEITLETRQRLATLGTELLV